MKKLKRKRLKKIFFKRFLAVTLTFLLFVSLCSCKKQNQNKKVGEFLMTDGFSAEFDFVFSQDGADPLSGSACGQKNEKSRIVFSSPEPLSGLSVESDEMSDVGTLIFNYYGMRTPMPVGSLSKINLLLSFFSDETAKCVSFLPSKAFKNYDMAYGDFGKTDAETLKECAFSLADGTECTLVFTAEDGFPVFYSAKKDGICADLTFTKIKPPAKDVS